MVAREALMQWFRTIPRFVRALVALFVLAQFAGVVSSPLTQARTASGAAISHVSHHHADGHHAAAHRADGHRHNGCLHPDGSACPDHADYCCALHAFFAGILPPAAVIDNVVLASERLRPAVTDVALGLDPGRLDRPPRPRS
jgi:hypothetical protein